MSPNVDHSLPQLAGDRCFIYRQNSLRFEGAARQHAHDWGGREMVQFPAEMVCRNRRE
jgi:hypothetical protein